MPDANWEPDTNYDGVPLWTRKGIFNSKDGLIILAFHFRSADAVRIEQQFLRDIGPPSQGLSWGNGTSVIFLQPGMGPENEYGLLLFMQDKYAPRVSKDPAQK